MTEKSDKSVIVIDTSIHKKLKVLAVLQGKTMKSLIEEILTDYLIQYWQPKSLRKGMK